MNDPHAINTELHTFGERCPTCGPSFRCFDGKCCFARITLRAAPPPAVPAPASGFAIGVDWGASASETVAVVVRHRNGSTIVLYAGPVAEIPARYSEAAGAYGAGKAVGLDELTVRRAHPCVTNSIRSRAGKPGRAPARDLPPWRGETWRRGRRRP